MPTTIKSHYRPISNDSSHIKTVFSSSPYLLFDCDGLILDTEPIYSKVALVSLKHFLPTLEALDSFPRHLKLKIMGGTNSQVSKQMAEHVNSLMEPNCPQISAEDWSQHTTPLETLEFSLGCPLMPGIFEFVSLAKSKELSTAVATSSSRHTFHIKSGPHAQLFSQFDSITCGDDPDFSIPNLPLNRSRPTVKGKPHPSIFLTAKHHLNLQDHLQGIVLEDSPNGVVAALRSGHSCIWIPSIKNGSNCFSPIDDIINNAGVDSHEIPNGLWVYQADSMCEIIEILKNQ